MTIRFAFQLNVFIIVVLFLLLLLFYLVLFFLMELLHDLFHKMPYWQEVFQLVFCWSVWRWEAIIRRKAWKTTSNFRALLKIVRKYDCFNCFGYMVWRFSISPEMWELVLHRASSKAICGRCSHKQHVYSRISFY